MVNNKLLRLENFQRESGEKKNNKKCSSIIQSLRFLTYNNIIPNTRVCEPL